MKKARAAAFVAVAVVAIVAGILLIPTPLRVQGTLVLTAAKPEEIYAEVPGRLVELQRQRRRLGQEGTRHRHALEPREACASAIAAPGAARRQLRQGRSGSASAPTARAAASRRQHEQMATRPGAGDRQDQRADRQADARRPPRRPGRWACPTTRRSASGSSRASRSARSATPTSSRPT